MKRSGEVITFTRDHLARMWMALLDPDLEDRDFFMYFNIHDLDGWSSIPYFPDDVSGPGSKSLCSARSSRYASAEEKNKVFTFVLDDRDQPTEFGPGNLHQAVVLDFNQVPHDKVDECNQMLADARGLVENLIKFRRARIVNMGGGNLASPAEAANLLRDKWQAAYNDFLHSIWMGVCTEPTCAVMDRDFEEASVRALASVDKTELQQIVDKAQQSQFFAAGVKGSVDLLKYEIGKMVAVTNTQGDIFGFAAIHIYDDFEELAEELGDQSYQEQVVNKNLTEDNCVGVLFRYLFVAGNMRGKNVSHFVVDELFHYVHQLHPNKQVLGFVHVVKPPEAFHEARKFWEEHQKFGAWCDVEGKGHLLLGTRLM